MILLSSISWVVGSGCYTTLSHKMFSSALRIWTRCWDVLSLLRHSVAHFNGRCKCSFRHCCRPVCVRHCQSPGHDGSCLLYGKILTKYTNVIITNVHGNIRYIFITLAGRFIHVWLKRNKLSSSSSLWIYFSFILKREKKREHFINNNINFENIYLSIKKIGNTNSK